MLLDVQVILQQPGLILLLTVGLTALKTLTGSAAIFLLGFPLRTAVLVGVGLSQVGESLAAATAPEDRPAGANPGAEGTGVGRPPDHHRLWRHRAEHGARGHRRTDPLCDRGDEPADRAAGAQPWSTHLLRRRHPGSGARARGP